MSRNWEIEEPVHDVINMQYTSGIADPKGVGFTPSVINNSLLRGT